MMKCKTLNKILPSNCWPPLFLLLSAETIYLCLHFQKCSEKNTGCGGEGEERKRHLITPVGQK